MRREAVSRPRAVAADFTRDDCGVGPALLPRGTTAEFWHLAARLGLPWHARRETFAANVGATRRLLSLARTTGTVAFNHVSTVYAAGGTQGPVAERLVAVARPRNPYEASTIAAERLVGRQLDFRVRILRPGVVIGHSATLEHPGRGGGPFAVQRIIADHARAVRTGPGAAPLRLVARPEAPLNLVPVDHVVREAVEISRSAEAAGVFHLTNSTPPTTGAVLGAFAANAGLDAAFVPRAEELSGGDRDLHQLLGAYVPYFTTAQRFRRDRTDAVVADPARASFPMTHDHLRAGFRSRAMP